VVAAAGGRGSHGHLPNSSAAELSLRLSGCGAERSVKAKRRVIKVSVICHLRCTIVRHRRRVLFFFLPRAKDELPPSPAIPFLSSPSPPLPIPPFLSPPFTPKSSYGVSGEHCNSNIITRISIQTAGLAFGGTGLCSYRIVTPLLRFLPDLSYKLFLHCRAAVGKILNDTSRRAVRLR